MQVLTLKLIQMSYHSIKKGDNLNGRIFRKKKKVCYMCAGHDVDYKDVETLKKFVNERGKILPRRVTGNCAKHQRHIASQVKVARQIALLPYAK